MINITVLTLVDRVSTFYSLTPFFTSKNKAANFTYTTDSEWCLNKDKNTILILMRQFIKPDRVDLSLLEKLRNKYRRIAFFHDDAGGGIPRLEVLPFVDLFYSKALFKDRTLYERPLYGKELYSDYYHTVYGVVDPDYRERPAVKDAAQLDKLRLSWNIGIGDYPRHQLRQRAGVAAARVFGPATARFFALRKELDPEAAVRDNKGLWPVHARIGLISRPSISYQRSLILDKISGNPLFLTGYASQSQFNKETAHSKIVLSPFGWGELCLRDFETVRSGALLLKPDMSHLETWPNVFIPGETYVPFDWDAKTLVETAETMLEADQERQRIVRNAAAAYKEALDAMPERFDSTIKEIIQ
ncbi:glycosyltransferase [Treponema zuelzerae]|uniref:Glycosyltransferase n=1 Tax=Teretinema zuelzerae TaxID=156 RepID=A0AAE3EHU0_9SPIR|nr:glycosyltransferase [Teretinema zuelzerae]MCD1654661.1 glycosyltransferase [Teretinema zuelzerae]